MATKALEDIRTQIKQGREKAFFGKYKEALDIFQKALGEIDIQKQLVQDKDLIKSYNQFVTDIVSEKKIVEELYSVISKGQIIEKENQSDIMMDQQEEGYQNQQYSRDNQQIKPKEKQYPFGQRPFQHHQEQKYGQQRGSQDNNYDQQNNNDPYADPWPQKKNNIPNKNNNYQKKYSNQYSNNIPVNNMQPNIFAEGNNDFLRPNLQNYNNKQDKDPDVWEPAQPLPKKPVKKFSQPANNNNKNNYLDKIKGGKKSEPPQNNRNYTKPWNVNAKTPKIDNKKVQGNGEENFEEREKSFLYSVYPEGNGPDKDLIEMLEREVIDKNPNVKFEDIAELETAKDILQEAVLLPILMPKYFVGIKRPWKGVLLFGPPGTGKTMLAKAVATTGKTTFFNVSASSLASKWRGEAEKLVRILFEMARFYAPTTIFFDEVDALGSKRVEGENEATRRVKSEMLIQMDGCGQGGGSEEEKKTVMVLAATNHPWDLDEALRRRLEKRIIIPLPSEEGRKQLFEINLRDITMDDNIDWDKLVKATEGFSGADIANICREAALFPMRRLLKKQGGFKNINNMEQLQKDADIPLTMQDFDESLKNSNKSVSNSDLKRFEDWMAEFGSV